MRKKNIVKNLNFSWPAKLSDFSNTNPNEMFSRGKLKVFYKGETADHRYFSDEFAASLLETLPYTPVVSYYDQESEDFVGHATEQQILGIVDPVSGYSFEADEDGKVWCVCDVVFYTERPDTVGELAKKIVGHPQSLELDPRTVEYKINYDDKGRFRNIEFTAGQFVGVSVLGLNQEPAFTGSSFFTVNDEVAQKLQLLSDYCENKTDHNGGIKMNTNKFMELSWGEIAEKVQAVLDNKAGEDKIAYIVDMYDNTVVYYEYDFETGKSLLLKSEYTIEEEHINLTEGKAVRVVYEEINAEAEEQFNEASEQSSVEETTEETFEETTEETFEEEEEEVEEEKEEEEEDINDIADHAIEETTVEVENHEAAEEVENCEAHEILTVEETAITSLEQETNENQEMTQSTSFTTLSDREREEFETLKREKRLSIINNYKEFLTDDVYNSLVENCMDMSEDELELAGLKAFKSAKEKEVRNHPSLKMFSTNPIHSVSATSSAEKFVARYLSK